MLCFGPVSEYSQPKDLVISMNGILPLLRVLGLRLNAHGQERLFDITAARYNVEQAQ